MTEKRYYQKDYGEEYYIFDSNTISEDDFEERVEYEGYDVFADSLIGSEIIDLLNENEHLKQQDKINEDCYKKLLQEYDNLKKEIKELEFDVRYFETTYEIEERGLDIVPEMCTITSSTPSRKELFKENVQLKEEIGKLKHRHSLLHDECLDVECERDSLKKDVHSLEEENEQLIKFKNQVLKELRVYRNIARCSNCKYHNYDWFDDGDEFEVCDKGNDVTEGICEDWEELE